MPSSEMIAEFYEQDYHAHWETHQNFNVVYEMKLLTARSCVGHITRYRSSGKFLDIGCAYGYTLEAAKSVGFETYGVELAPEALQFVKQRGHVVFDRPIEKLDLPDGEFDVVSMVDLIEHIPAPTEFCEQVYRILRQNGLIVIITPNVDSWTAKLMGKYWPHYEKEHLCYFGRQSLSYLLRKSGFELISLGVARKFLTFAYVIGHFQHFVGGWPTLLLRWMKALVPELLASYPIKMPTEMLAIARKR